MFKEIKPAYYDNFACVAGACTFTCCQEWKIAVDDETYTKWKKTSLFKQKSICLSRYVKQKNGAHEIVLTNEKKCPFLNKDKLCDLVIELGDEILSKTCAIFPRQIHEFMDRTEYSLVSCCPAVVDIWNSQDNITFTQNLKDVSQDTLYKIRTLTITILQNKVYSVSKKLLLIFYILLDIHKKEKITEKILKEYEDKDTLQGLSETIDQMQFSNLNTFQEKNELFLDLAENYRKEGRYIAYLEEIAQLAEKLSKNYDKNEMVEQLQQFEELFMIYEKLFQNYLIAEVFTNSLVPDADMVSMIVMMQWISMEYAMIKHTIFLEWMLHRSKEISYTVVRDYMVVVSRMTGYDQEDIYEYLENSFQNLIWDWGYMALIIGKPEK